jgi:hypothetical protein
MKPDYFSEPEDGGDMFLRNGLPHAIKLVSCSAYFFTLKMETISSSETARHMLSSWFLAQLIFRP